MECVKNVIAKVEGRWLRYNAITLVEHPRHDVVILTPTNEFTLMAISYLLSSAYCVIVVSLDTRGANDHLMKKKKTFFAN